MQSLSVCKKTRESSSNFSEELWLFYEQYRQSTLQKNTKVFGVVKSMVHRWIRQYEETGDLSDKPVKRD